MEDKKNINEEETLSKLINDVPFIQPFIMGSDKPIDRDMLHSAPLNASAEFNRYVMNNKEEFMKNVKNSAYMLSDNQKAITAKNYTEFLMRNTFINYCAMVDNFGYRLKKLISVVPLKETLYSYMFGERSVEYASTLKNIVAGYIYGIFNASGSVDFVSDDDEFVARARESRYATQVVSSQINQELFSIICHATDTAVSQVYDNVFGSPNYKHILDNAIEILGFEVDKKNSASAAWAISSAIKEMLAGAINNLMTIITANTDNSIMSGLFGNFYFVFDMFKPTNRPAGMIIKDKDDDDDEDDFHEGVNIINF